MENKVQMAIQGIVDLPVVRTALKGHQVLVEGQVNLDSRAYQG